MAQKKAQSAAKTAARAQVNIRAAGAGRVVRLSDPDVKPRLKKTVAEITSSKEKSIEFLQQIGMLTSSGKLSRKYGGRR